MRRPAPPSQRSKAPERGNRAPACPHAPWTEAMSRHQPDSPRPNGIDWIAFFFLTHGSLQHTSAWCCACGFGCINVKTGKRSAVTQVPRPSRNVRGRKLQTTPRGFEPLRAEEPNGFLVHLLNRPDTVSCNSKLLLYFDGKIHGLCHHVPHGTCLLSVSSLYLALDEIYHPIYAPIPRSVTLRASTVHGGHQAKHRILTPRRRSVPRGLPGSGRGPSDLQSGALPIELSRLCLQ